MVSKPDPRSLDKSAVNRFVDEFNRDLGLRICTQDARKDRDLLKVLAEFASRGKVQERQKIKRALRFLDTSFTQRILYLKDRTPDEWNRACDLLLDFNEGDNESRPDEVVQAEKGVTLSDLFDHPNWSLHEDYKFEDLRLRPDLVRAVINSGLQNLVEVEIYDPHFVEWLVNETRDYSDQRHLCGLALRFIETVWSDVEVRANNAPNVIIYSEAKTQSSEYLATNIRKKVAQFTKSTHLTIPIEVRAYRRRDLKVADIDRFIRFGNWAFKLEHGLDYLGFLEDGVQIPSSPEEYDHRGRTRTKKYFGLEGPRAEYLKRTKEIASVATSL